MPLSEHEERVLAEIERQLADEDPRFFERARKASDGTLSRGRLIWATVGFVIGLIVLLGLVFNPVLGYVGFAIMFGSVIVAVPEIQRLLRKRATEPF